MKAEDLLRYQRMLEQIEREVGRFHLAFGCPGMGAIDLARSAEAPDSLKAMPAVVDATNSRSSRGPATEDPANAPAIRLPTQQEDAS